jgi:hypothetical protein
MVASRSRRLCSTPSRSIHCCAAVGARCACHDLRREDRAALVHRQLDRNDEYAGVALLALVLNHPESAVALPRIKRALVSPSAQTRANALQSLGHYARLQVDRWRDGETTALCLERPDSTTSLPNPWLRSLRGERCRHVRATVRPSSVVAPTVFGAASAEEPIASNRPCVGALICRNLLVMER